MLRVVLILEEFLLWDYRSADFNGLQFDNDSTENIGHCDTLTRSRALPVKHNHRRATPMTGRVLEIVCGHLLTSAIDMATRLIPAFGSC